MRGVVLLATILSLLISVEIGSAAKSDGPKSGSDTIEVFVVPHSHDDVGWLLTLEGYYDNYVQYIYDTVIQNLINNPDRRYIVVEIAYLNRWWNDPATSPEAKKQMQQLFQRGQLGWVMSDEAAAIYYERILQLEEGHRFLVENFGPTALPRYGWQIDPFGPSRGTPLLFSFDCFDGTVIDRIPWEIKDYLQGTQQMEFLWYASDNLGAETEMFTHLMDVYGYCTAGGFSFGDGFDIYSGNPNPPIQPFNVAERAEAFVQNVQQRASWYATNNLLWPFGCDFNFPNAYQMYINMDKLIDYINTNGSFGVHVQYALLSDYFEAVMKTDNEWPTFSGDYFPYNDNPISFWTGYYTSRVAMKETTRWSDWISRTAETLNVIDNVLYGGNLTQWFAELDVMRQALSVAMHHDAISGTARTPVLANYLQMQSQGANATNTVSLYTLGDMLSAGGAVEPPPLNLNFSALSVLLDGMTVPIVVYNSLGWRRTEYIAVPVPLETVTVLDSTGKAVPIQLVEGWSAETVPAPSTTRPGSRRHGDSEGLFTIEDDYDYTGYYTLYFLVDVPAMGFATYYVSPNGDTQPTVVVPETTYIGNPVKPRRGVDTDSANDIIIANDYLEMVFDATTGLLTQVTNLRLNSTFSISQNYWQYNSSTDPAQPSGAYIFRPMDEAPAAPFGTYEDVELTITTVIGPLVQQLIQVFSFTCEISPYTSVRTNVTQVTTLFNSQGYGDVFDHALIWQAVGPIDGGKEFITRYVTNWTTGGFLYQEDSGLLTMQRAYSQNASDIISGNYYPMPSAAYIRDTDGSVQLTILNRQSHGVSSQEEGMIEAMIHRRTLMDDGRGVNEPLNDTDRVIVPHAIIIDSPEKSEDLRHTLFLSLNFPLVPFFGVTNSFYEWSADYFQTFSALTSDLPVNVHIESLRVYSSIASVVAPQNAVILRLQHLFEEGASPKYSQPVTIDLSNLFSEFTVVSATELTLSGNMPAAQCPRLTRAIGRRGMKPLTAAVEGDDMTVTLYPSEIRTFQLQLKPSSRKN